MSTVLMVIRVSHFVLVKGKDKGEVGRSQVKMSSTEMEGNRPRFPLVFCGRYCLVEASQQSLNVDIIILIQRMRKLENRKGIE